MHDQSKQRTAAAVRRVCVVVAVSVLITGAIYSAGMVAFQVPSTVPLATALGVLLILILGLLGIVSAPEKVDLPWILKVSSGFVTWSARSSFTTTVVVVVLVVAVFSMMAGGVGSVHEFVGNPSCKGPLRISGWPWAVMNQGSGQTTVAVWSPLGSEHAASVVACGSPTDALNWAAGGVACCSESRIHDVTAVTPTNPDLDPSPGPAPAPVRPTNSRILAGIRILHVIYGASVGSCNEDFLMKVIEDRCRGLQNCALLVSSNLCPDGDPAVGVRKVMSVAYDCSGDRVDPISVHGWDGDTIALNCVK